MENNMEKIRHSLSHLMAHAVMEVFPEAKFGIGPVIEDGFYYDFELPRPLTPQDLPKIEKIIKKLIQQNVKFEKQVLAEKQAREISQDQPYKLELIDELAREKKPITYYRSGKFTDLCAGPHVISAKEIKADAFKLTRVAGAYWRGDEKNKMLQRVYGVAFGGKKELEEYLKLQEEVKKRDHRKIGAELGLFSFHDIAPGAVFWHPAGMVVYRQIEDLLRAELNKDGYREIKTPQLISESLWKKSGHWEHYRDNMFLLNVEKQQYSLKPMNCPGSTFVYNSTKRSYRDFPLRLAEFGLNSRNELSGALGGIFRVRQFTMDDAHIYCAAGQIEQEVKKCLILMKRIYKIFGLNPKFFLATMPDKHLGGTTDWRDAEKMLSSALKKNKIPYQLKEKDGAFYGPKIDIYIEDALKRSWQLTTIQLDFQLPERLGLVYTDEYGKEKRPIIIHRAIIGSFERFIGILTEHYAGAFPVWLSPVQVRVMTVGKAHVKHAKKLHEEFMASGIRSELDNANETVGYKIRLAEKQKVPYMLVIGDKEMKSHSLYIRARGKKSLVKLPTNKFINRVLKEIEQKK